MTYDCMTPEELAAWQEASRQVRNGGRTPCVDCPLWFAAAMRLEGRCCGSPREVAPPASNRRTEQMRRASREYRRRVRARYNDEWNGSEASVPILRPGTFHS